MTATPRSECPRCGATLPEGTPARECPACLLRLGLEHGACPPPPPVSVAELQSLFPELEVLELVGQGGMGAVFRCRQPRLGRDVALKVLTGVAGRDPQFLGRFELEARALASLDHPGIVSVYDSGQRGDLAYFVMEYVDGPNLRELMRDGRLRPTDALPLVGEMCAALQYAHDHGIVHRDVKPENVLLDARGRVKLTDFGLAKLLARTPESLTRSDQVMGTPHYMAPEQIRTPNDVDHRADIYSLGVIFYELLTGELPMGRFEPPSSKAQVEQGLDDVVLKTLERDRERRYQRADEVKTDVDLLATKRATAAPERKRSSRWQLSPFQFVITTTVVAAATVFVLWIADQKQEAELHGLGCERIEWALEVPYDQRVPSLTMVASGMSEGAAGPHVLGRHEQLHLIEATFEALSASAETAAVLVALCKAQVLYEDTVRTIRHRFMEVPGGWPRDHVLKALFAARLKPASQGEHQAVCPLIQLASSFGLLDVVRDYLTVIARRGDLTPHEQRHLLDALTALPIELSADAFLTAFAAQPLEPENRAWLLAYLESARGTDPDRERVLEELRKAE